MKLTLKKNIEHSSKLNFSSISNVIQFLVWKNKKPMSGLYRFYNRKQQSSQLKIDGTLKCCEALSY